MNTSPLMMSADQLSAALKAQGVPRNHIAFKCPKCSTVQSARDFIRAGVGPSVDDVSEHLGTDCIGRFTGAPTARAKPDGQPCSWTLSGLLQPDGFEVIDNGVSHPMFEPASHSEAQAHMRKAAELDAGLRTGPYGFEDFFREAAESNLTAADLVPELAKRPEFSDCVAEKA